MPFTNPDFPGQEFKSIEELREAYRKRESVEREIAYRTGEITKVTATIIPAPRDLLEKKISYLERKVAELSKQLEEREEYHEEENVNKDGLPVGMVLQGESKGQRYTLEVLADNYLCSTGHIEPTLSAAAERVSGNRRSGWKFWRDFYGNPIGEATGRFEKANATRDSFADPMPQM